MRDSLLFSAICHVIMKNIHINIPNSPIVNLVFVRIYNFAKKFLQGVFNIIIIVIVTCFDILIDLELLEFNRFSDCLKDDQCKKICTAHTILYLSWLNEVWTSCCLNKGCFLCYSGT